MCTLQSEVSYGLHEEENYFGVLLLLPSWKNGTFEKASQNSLHGDPKKDQEETSGLFPDSWDIVQSKIANSMSSAEGRCPAGLSVSRYCRTINEWAKNRQLRAYQPSFLPKISQRLAIQSAEGRLLQEPREQLPSLWSSHFNQIERCPQRPLEPFTWCICRIGCQNRSIYLSFKGRKHPRFQLVISRTSGYFRPRKRWWNHLRNRKNTIIVSLDNSKNRDSSERILLYSLSMLRHEELSYSDLRISEPKMDLSFVQVDVIWVENRLNFDGGDQRN